MLQAPAVSWPASGSSSSGGGRDFFTLILLDLHRSNLRGVGGDPQSGLNFVHWLVVNVPDGGGVADPAAVTLLSYEPPFAFPFTQSTASVPFNAASDTAYALLAFRQTRFIRRRPRQQQQGTCGLRITDRIMVRTALIASTDI